MTKESKKERKKERKKEETKKEKDVVPADFMLSIAKCAGLHEGM